MTKAQAATAAAAAINAGYQCNVYSDGAGVWHLNAQPVSGGAALTAGTVATFATSNSIANANVPSADLY